jgi:hypothetical protein
MMEMCLTNCLLWNSSRLPQVIHPSDSTCCNPKLLSFQSLYRSPSVLTYAITSVVRYVTSHAKNHTFFCLSYVLGSPNKIYAWSLKVCTICPTLTFVTHRTNQICICDQACKNFCDELSNEFYNNPPCPSVSFHHKICSRPAQGVHPDHPSTAMSTEPLS